MANDDLNKMSIKQLESKLKDNEEALLNFRFQKVLQQLTVQVYKTNQLLLTLVLLMLVTP